MRVEELSTLCVENKSQIILHYEKTQKHLSRCRNEFAGNDNDFIVRILRVCLGLKTTRKLVVRNTLMQGNF